MSIFSTIMSAIVRSANSIPPNVASGISSDEAMATASPTRPAAAPLSKVDVAAVMADLASKNSEHLDWRRSIVDLMKLLDLDSSLPARKELARELNYTGRMSDSVSMNMWLHKRVMQMLAENGGKVPADLKAA